MNLIETGNLHEKTDLFRSCPPPPPSLVGAYYLHPRRTYHIFLHNNLLCSDTCSVSGGAKNVLGGTNGKDPKTYN